MDNPPPAPPAPSASEEEVLREFTPDELRVIESGLRAAIAPDQHGLADHTMVFIRRYNVLAALLVEEESALSRTARESLPMYDMGVVDGTLAVIARARRRLTAIWEGE